VFVEFHATWTDSFNDARITGSDFFKCKTALRILQLLRPTSSHLGRYSTESVPMEFDSFAQLRLKIIRVVSARIKMELVRNAFRR